MHQLFSEGRGFMSLFICEIIRTGDNSSAVHCMWNVAPTPNRTSRGFFFSKALSAFYDLVASHFHLSDLLGGLLDHHASSVFNKSFCPRDLLRFIYTIQTRRFFNCWTGGESERGERWERNRRRWQKRKGVSLARKGGGDVKSEPPSAVMIGAVLARPARVLPCVRWTAGFGKKGPHSAGFAQMLASVPHSSRLWQRAGERRGATTGKRDRNLISYH